MPTRGTTGTNRLRRADRWMTYSPRVRAALQSGDQPVVVDLGYGRLPVTTLELADRLRSVRPDIRVVGLEIDPDRVAAALSRQPHDITEHEALVRAHTEVFRAAQRGEPGAMSFDRISGFLSIVNNTPMLGLASFTFRPDGSTHAVVTAIARRMQVPVTHPAVRIVFDTWAVLMATALGIPGRDADDPTTVSERVESTYAIFTRLWQPWLGQDQPRSGDPGS